MDESYRLMRDYEERSRTAQGAAAQAFARLLLMAERSDSGQAGRIAQFIAATYNGDAYGFDLFDLRAVDVGISDDMLACLDALRWGKCALCELVPDGDQRVRALCQAWGIQPRN